MSNFNPLFSAPTTSIVINGVEYKLNTNFNAAIEAWEIIEMYEHGDIEEQCDGDIIMTNATFNHMLIDKMYLDPKPDIFSEDAIKLISDYLCSFNKSASDSKKSKMPPYGYLAIEQDADMLYGAFLTIGIKLRETPLTYENFLAHLPNLPENCEYCRIMSLRSRWYDNRPKKEELKELKKQIERIGWSKVLIKTRKEELQNKAVDEYLQKIENIRNGIIVCKSNNKDEISDGICSRKICFVYGESIPVLDRCKFESVVDTVD